MGRLEGRVAIITGGGQGIGLCYAERFLQEGAKVVVAEINDERAESAMKHLAGKGDAVSVHTDISDEQSALDCAAKTMEQFGKIDIPSTTRRSTTTSTTPGTTTSTSRRCSR
jgi:glucose 1-dehydrogenase